MIPIASPAAESSPPPRWPGRLSSALVLIFWVLVLGLIALPAPAPIAVLGLAWAALGARAPRWYLLSLAAALPFFGNNPGGPHHLYLLEMGLIGFVGRDLAMRVAGRHGASSGLLTHLLRIYFLVATITLIPQLRFLYCEAAVQGWRALFRVYNHYATAPVFGLRVWLDLALGLSFYAALRDDPPPPAWRKRLWIALLGALAFSAVLGLLDYAGLISLKFWRGENPDLLNLNSHRLQSLFWHSGWYAEYLAALGPAALAFGLGGDVFHDRFGVKKFACFALAALLALTMLLTLQRAGWIAMAAGYGAVTLVFIMRSRPQARRRIVRWTGSIIAFYIVIALALMLLIPALRSRVAEIARARDRVKIWSAAWEMATIDPWAGVGLGNYFNAFFPKDHPKWVRDNNTAHDSYLHIFAESGIFAAIAFIAVMVLMLAVLWRAASDSGGADEAQNQVPGEALALLGAMAALATYAVFQHILIIRVIALIFWMMLGLSVAHGTDGAAAAAHPRASMFRRRLWIAAALAIACIVLAHEKKHFEPWKIWGAGDRNYFAGPRSVALDPPEGTDRVRLSIYCWFPRQFAPPFTYTFEFAGRRLATEQLDNLGYKTVTLDLPPGRRHGEKLVITSSQVWSPYRWGSDGMIYLPILELGVCYTPLESVSP